MSRARAMLTMATGHRAKWGVLVFWLPAAADTARDRHLMAVLNVSHQLTEAVSALRTSGERVPPLVTEDIERLADAIDERRGAGSEMIGRGGRRVRQAPPGALALPVIPPAWSFSPGALMLRDAVASLVPVLEGNWTSAPPATPAPTRS